MSECWCTPGGPGYCYACLAYEYAPLYSKLTQEILWHGSHYDLRPIATRDSIEKWRWSMKMLT